MPPVVVTPPSEEPISLSELKLAAHITHTDEDTFLTRIITAARIRYELDTSRTLVSTVFDWFLPCFNSWEYVGSIADGRTISVRSRVNVRSFEIPNPPLVSIDEVEYYDTDGTLTILPTTVYAAKTSSEPGKIYTLPNQEWPDLEDDRIEDVVRIRFTAGNADAASVPEDDKQALYLLAQHWIENREAVVLDDRIRAAEVPLTYRWLMNNRSVIHTD